MNQTQVNNGTQDRARTRRFNIKTGALMGGALDGGLEFMFRRMENPEESMATSVAFAGATAAAWYYLPHLMWAKTAVDMSKAIGEGAHSAYKAKLAQTFNEGKANFGGNFQDTEIGATMRQRGVAAMQQSRMNARSFLGNEARTLHRY